jgi:hypothetical protein
MPEDKPYIQKVYNFMTSAYGANGVVAPNAFRSDYNTFASRLSADPKYADKIYGALADAYGSNGSAKREAFTSTVDQFRTRVLGGKEAETQTRDSSSIAPTPVSDNPVDKVLASAKEIPTTLYKDNNGTFSEKKQPGLMQDQSAFEPLIARKESQDKSDFEAGKNMLLTPKADQGINMNPVKQAPSEVETSIQNKLQHLDEQDKLLHESQQKADEFYKTTAGGLYYSFVRPVYQTMFNLGKDVTAGGLRLAGDVGEGLGLDHSKKVLNKAADGLVDYFDFNRLAREGNTSSFLNTTPTAQQGKLSTVNVLPKAMEAISSMAGLMGGARVLGGSEGALFTSSFMSTYEGYRKTAKDNGLSNAEADNFALTSAGVTSALEMISPNKYLLGHAEGALGSETIFKAIKNGVPVKQAIKQGIKTGLGEIGAENLQEFSQNVADKVIRGGTDLVTGKNRFNEDGALPSFQENLETAVLTTIATGIMSAKHISHNSTPSAIEQSAWAQAAQSPEGFNSSVDKAVNEQQIDKSKGEVLKEQVADYKSKVDALVARNMQPDRAAKIALEAVKSERLKEQSKPLNGIPALETLNAEDEQAQAQIANNVKNVIAGVPEVGTELTPEDVKDILSQTGGENKVDNVGDNVYKVSSIDLQQLYNSNAEFKDYVDNGKLRPSGNKEGLRMPVIMNSDGNIIDGTNRLAQLYVDGQEKATVIKELQQNNIHVEGKVDKPRIVPMGNKESSVSVTRPTVPNIIATAQTDNLEKQNQLSEPEASQNTPQAINPDTHISNTEERDQSIPAGDAKIARDQAMAELKATVAEPTTDPDNEEKRLLPVEDQEVKTKSALKEAIKSELNFRGHWLANMPESARNEVKQKMYDDFSSEFAIPEETFNEAFEALYNENSAPLKKEKAFVESLFDGTKTSTQIVQGISQLVDDKFLTTQIQALLPYLEKNPEIKFSRMFNQSVGEAFTTGDWTVLPAHAKNKEKLAYAVVHELYHTISLNELFNNRQFNDKIGQLVSNLRDQLGLTTYFDDVNGVNYASKKNMKYYGLLNTAEFISEIFSNKEFSALVDKTTLGKKKPILTRIIDYVKSALRIKSSSTGIPSSDKIRQMILSSIDTKIEFDKSGEYDHIIKTQKQNKQDSKFNFSPESVNKWGTKEARDQAVEGLKGAWNEFQNKERKYHKSGIDIPDPIMDKQFYKALAKYIKAEILYRVNQVKGFAGQRKAKIKRDIYNSIKKEGISIKDISVLNEAFEEAYAEAKEIPGVLSENDDRISFKKYIKDRIRVREAAKRKGFAEGKAEGLVKGKEMGKQTGIKKGIKEGAQAAKERVSAVRGAILETLKNTGVNLSMRQKRRLLSILEDATTSRDIDKTIARAIDATTQMIWEQKNKEKIDQTKKLIKSLNKLKRSKAMVLQDVEWVKQLKLPSPSQVDDLDTYHDMLSDFIQSRKGNEYNPTFTKEEINDFVTQENERIYKEKRKSMQEDLDALKEKGNIPDDVTLNEYISLLDNETPEKLKEGISVKDELLRRELKKKLGYLNDRLSEYRGLEKQVIKRLIQVDPGELKSTDLIRLNNVLNNIAEYGTLDSAGDIVTTYEANQAVKELAQRGDKIRELPLQKIIERKNLSNIISAIFYNDDAVSAFRSKTIGPIERVLSPVHSKIQYVVKQFVDLNRKHNINGLGNAKLHAFAYLNQYRGVENGEISDNLKMKLDELLDDAKYFLEESNRLTRIKGKAFLENAIDRLDALKAIGLIDYNITESKTGKKKVRNLKIDIKENFDSENPIKSLSDAWESLSPGEQEVYNFVRDHYDLLADKLEFITRTYAGKEFKRERNYVSQVAKKKDGQPQNGTEMSGETDITYGLRSINSKPAGTTISRTDKKGEDVYYDGDFFSNFVNRYYQSVYTSEVLPALQTVAKTVNNKDFEKYITGQLDKGFSGKGADNFTAFKNKLIQAVNEGKYAPFFQAKSKDPLSNIATNLISSGVRLALNNVWQGPAQLAPALIHNLAIADPKAVAFAIGSAFKSLSPTDRQYARDRAAFLNNFTGVKRSALGSEAYDNYIKRIGNNPGWWVNAQSLLGHIRKASAFSLEKGDRAAQNAAYISGYITSLIKQGELENPADFDFAEAAANPNAKALSFAEQTASAINNESAREYKPDVLKDSKNAKYLWMLQGFSLNAYQNAMSKAKVIWNNRSTTAERNEAALHFVGYLGELATYQLVKKAARGFQFALAGALVAALFGVNVDESDDEKKQRQIKDHIRMGANSLADLTLAGQNAVPQIVVKGLINLGYSQWAKAEVRNKRKASDDETFNPNGTYLSPYFVPFYGVDGAAGGAEFYSAAGKKAIDAIAHQMHWDSDPDAEEDKPAEQKRLETISKNLSRTASAAATLTGSSDLIIINNKMQQRLKSAVKKAKEEE